MEMRSGLALRGQLLILAYPAWADGVVTREGLDALLLHPPLWQVRQPNLVVVAGRNLVRDFLAGQAVTGIQRYAVGTGTAAPAPNDIRLQNEVFRAQPTQLIRNEGSLTIKLYLSSQQLNGYTLAEAGAFGNGATDAANSGTLIARVTHTPVAKTASLALVYSHELRFEG